VLLQTVYRANREQKNVSINFYTSDLTLVISETDADKLGLGGECIPGAYLFPNRIHKKSVSFLFDNIRRAMWTIGLRPIRSKLEIP